MQGAWLFLVDSNLRMYVILVPVFSLHVFIWLTQELHSTQVHMFCLDLLTLFFFFPASLCSPHACVLIMISPIVNIVVIMIQSISAVETPCLTERVSPPWKPHASLK